MFRGTTTPDDPTPIDFGLAEDSLIRSVSPNSRYVLLGTNGLVPLPPNVGPLWTIDLNGQRQRNFVSSSDFWRVDGPLSPDRTKLAFTRLEGTLLDCSQIEADYEEMWCQFSSHVLYVIDLRQDEIVKIGSGTWAAWSPDSNLLAF